MRRTTNLLLLLTAITLPAAAQSAPEVRVELAPDPVGLDKLARLTVTVESSGFELPRIDPGFLLENLVGAGGPSRSQSMSWVNGQSTGRLELSWRLRPLAVGRARVHQIRVEVGAEIRTLPDLEIQVVEQAPPGRAQPPPDRSVDPFSRLFQDDPFGLFPRRRRGEPAVQPKLAVRSLVEPRSVFVGEQAVWTLVLETQTDVSGFRPRALPELAGLWTRELELPQRPRPEWVEIDGERYGRVPMLARALFPLRAGELTIEPVTVDVLARLADGDWIGGIRRDEQLVLEASRAALSVRPLPSPPPAFSGLVGRLELSATLEPAHVDAGQATTLVVRAVTTGNAQGMPPPTIVTPDGLRTFAPSASTEERATGGRLVTEVEWRYVVLADRAGDYQWPAVEVSYFDPVAQKFATARAEPLRLAVGPGAGTGEATSTMPPEPSPVASNRAGPPAAEGDGGPPLWAIAAGAALLLTLAVIAWTRWRRRDVAVRALRDELVASRSIEAPRTAARAIDEAWRRMLVQRHGLSRGTPLAQWLTALDRAGWREDHLTELERLFEELHLLEYAPELADSEALRRDIERRSHALARRIR